MDQQVKIIFENKSFQIKQFNSFIYSIEILNSDINDDDFNKFMSCVKEVFSYQKKFAVIFNLLEIDKIIPINYIYEYMVYIKNNINLLKKYLIGTVILTENIIGKFIFNVAICIHPPVKPTKIFTTTESSIEFLCHLNNTI